MSWLHCVGVSVCHLAFVVDLLLLLHIRSAYLEILRFPMGGAY